MSEEAEILQAPQEIPPQLATVEAIQSNISDRVEPPVQVLSNPPAEIVPVQENPSTTQSLIGLVSRAQELRQRGLDVGQWTWCWVCMTLTLSYLTKLATLVAVLMTPATLYQATTADQACSEGSSTLWLLTLYSAIQVWKYCRNSEEMDCVTTLIFLWANINYFSKQGCSPQERLNLLFALISFAPMYLCIFIVLAICACCSCCCILALGGLIIGRSPNLNGLLRNKEKALRAIVGKNDIDPQVECPICFEKELDSELPCKHQFHRTCIQNWFNNKTTCPACRKEFG